MKNVTIDKINYKCYFLGKEKYIKKSIEVIGIDTEAYTDGRCFLFATSEEDVFPIEDFPQALFTRKYRDSNFVAYNLSYDESAFFQVLPIQKIKVLWKSHTVEHEGYKYDIIPKKCLTVTKNKHRIHIYDMYNFYGGSLKDNAIKYLDMKKIDSDVTKYTRTVVKNSWNTIAEYCVNDAIIVQRLAEKLIKKFEEFGVYPKKLYSTAYISYQYFRKKCNYVTVKRFWEDDKKLIDYAMQSYNGGKFEVTQKGTGYFHEYDIVSAYPYEIANLIDISWARVEYSNKYQKNAVYGFLNCHMNIPENVYSPIAIKLKAINIYPVGHIMKVITKNEYDYLVSVGVDITIKDAVWIKCDNKQYPYRKAILGLVEKKKQLKHLENNIDYNTVKIIMNSLYGKFMQLIEENGRYKATTCWNPIYGSVITANTRIKVSAMQAKFPSVIAVHTDSLISTRPLDIKNQGNLGDMIFECRGRGVVVGTGIYQIGKKSKFRGYHTKTPLLDMINVHEKYITVPELHAISWREVAFHNWEHSKINKFETVNKKVMINFDKKRLWLNDYVTFDELLRRRVDSMPIYNDEVEKLGFYGGKSNRALRV